MRAQVQRGFTPDPQVSIEEVPRPVPAPDEVLIAVAACALNRLDLLQQDAPLVRGFSLPHIAGLDVVGTVVETGSDVAAPPTVGDVVLVDPVSGCGECAACRAGRGPYCRDVRSIGSTRDGGFAELVAVPAGSCHPVPAGLSTVEAACLPVAYATAWHALVTAGRVRAGETVLVNAATSGVSTALVQLATAQGARVIGTAGGPEKAARALELGCSGVVDHRASPDVAAEVLDLTDGRGVDLVIDHVGPALFEASIASMATEGRMVFCGTTTGNRVELDLPAVYHWGRTLIGSGGYRPSEFTDMLGFVADHGLRPVIDSVRPFDDIAAAQDRMRDGGFVGKLVVTFDDRAADDGDVRP